MSDALTTDRVMQYLRGWRDTFRHSAFWEGFRDGVTMGPFWRLVVRLFR